MFLPINYTKLKFFNFHKIKLLNYIPPSLIQQKEFLTFKKNSFSKICSPNNRGYSTSHSLRNKHENLIPWKMGESRSVDHAITRRRYQSRSILVVSIACSISADSCISHNKTFVNEPVAIVSWRGRWRIRSRRNGPGFASPPELN